MGLTIHGKTVGNIGLGMMNLTLRPTRIPDEQIFATIKAALETGSNYLNASEFYGAPDHNSLTVLNKYFDKYPEDEGKFVINAKGCLPNFAPDNSPASVKTSIGNSVRLIGGKGRIDQFEPARNDAAVDVEVALKAIGEHVETGDIKGITLSEVNAETIRRAAKIANIEAVEVELSLWELAPLENGVAKVCAELGIPLLAYSPLGHGVLTGKVNKPSDIPEGDFRRTIPRFQGEHFKANIRLVREVEKLAAKKGTTPAQIAINWLLALARRPGMPTVVPIPGASSPAQVRENTVEIDLTDADMVEIDLILEALPVAGDPYGAHQMGFLSR
ncbi:NADP-dependent oxidoreductase domain-containing protein [Lasiosphaeria miniovina]|uniref:NADP-dependent oxidoreductase domain-containing protein n=1 Tax=Lasiosphaeria miniovina TaxID=1954250 RepID=A0AA40BGQ4_9PEZI|nr:NADP-dependent oxidoreductase domain-containing protein [Lasiosphaeria miniovina]KAK0733919.1 NADP-dependent oxidoreductase domain-containing protein [Lasiosphaeria miniovina]